jgi:microcystin-dependent protein
MPDSTTPNYGWTLPTNNADNDTWGTLLNANFVGVDATVAGVSAVANAAMPKAGGAFSGAVTGVSASFSGAVSASGGFTGALTGNVTGAVSGASGSCTGNAATASALFSAVTLAYTGDATGGPTSFTGASNISTALSLATVNANVGVFGSASAVPVVTVNAKGLVTGVSTAALMPGVPPGAILAFPVSTPPTGWLECDGSTYIASAYPNLYAALGGSGGSFTVPDLRGQFVRGWAHGGTVDAGRTLLSNQADQLQGFVMPINAPSGVLPAGTTGEGFTGVTGTNTSTPVTQTGPPISDGTHGTPRVGAETRPVNLALMYCIRT